jgi:hypothetical protein
VATLTKEGLCFDNLHLLQEEDLIKLGEPKFVAREKLNKLKQAHRDGNEPSTTISLLFFLSSLSR